MEAKISKKSKREFSLKVKRGCPVGRPLGCFGSGRPRAVAFLLTAALLPLSFEGILLARPPAPAPAPTAADSIPHLAWDDFFAKVETTGATFSDRIRALDGTRVVLRGYAVVDPKPEGGLFLTRFPEARLHPDDEDTLPWDSVGVVWRKSRKLPAIPRQPTIEGTLRLGNRELGTETVILVLEDAVPHLEPVPAARAGTGGRPSASGAER
jgi:hypothetical protein